MHFFVKIFLAHHSEKRHYFEKKKLFCCNVYDYSRNILCYNHRNRLSLFYFLLLLFSTQSLVPQIMGRVIYHIKTLSVVIRTRLKISLSFDKNPFEITNFYKRGIRFVSGYLKERGKVKAIKTLLRKRFSPKKLDEKFCVQE